MIMPEEKQPFYNRKEELEELNRAYSGISKGAAIVLYGRRRVGKTELVRELLRKGGKKGLYLYVDVLEKKQVLESFAADIREQLGETEKFSEWSDFFGYIYKKGETGPFIVAIDEFQRFRETAPEFITGLQRQWDERLKSCKLILLLVGSSIGMIDRITRSSAAPLYGRVSRSKISPFRYSGAREMLKELKEEDKIRFYSVFGGTPYYLGMAKKFQNVHTAIAELVLARNSILAEEPKNLMEYENFRTHARYNSVLQAIAAGKDNLKEISDYTGIRNTTLPAYLTRMKELLDLVDISNPVLGKAKFGKQAITDNFFRFWYKFVFPNQSAINLGNAKLVEQQIKENLETFVGKAFEGVVKELLIAYQNRKINGHTVSFDQLGSWWDRNGNEIDIIALNSREKTMIACEVKWANEKTDIGVLNTLLSRTRMLNFAGKITPMLVSRAGFTEGCMKEMERINGIAIDLQELGGLFEKA